MKVHILLKEDEIGRCPEVKVHAVYLTRQELEDRIDRIAKRNPYPMKRLGKNTWRIGPEEDEGFFGNHPIQLRAVEKEMG